MVSLLALAEITEEGVLFQSPHDGRPMMLTPEKSIELQNAIGADIMMQLDDVVGGGSWQMPQPARAHRVRLTRNSQIHQLHSSR